MSNLNNNDITNQSRRKLLKTVTAASTVLSAALVSAPVLAGHKHHEGNKMSTGKYEALLDACKHCQSTAQTCINHCIALVANDDTSIAECLAATYALLPALDAMITLATAESKHTISMAKVCMQVCEDCRVECEKHAHHHAECKACMESCEKCIEAIKATIA